MSVLVVVPTVKGREKILELCLEAYMDTCPTSTAITFHGYSTCGQVWNLGADYARRRNFKYVHMTADDLIPQPGWYECAIETVEAGHLPCALIRRPEGTVEVHGAWGKEQSDWTPAQGGSVPFCKTLDWIDIPEIHYYSDNAYDDAQTIVNGYSFMARTDYAFTHYTSAEGRKSLDQAEERIWQEWRANLSMVPREYSRVPPEYMPAVGDNTDPFTWPI